MQNKIIWKRNTIKWSCNVSVFTFLFSSPYNHEHNCILHTVLYDFAAFLLMASTLESDVLKVVEDLVSNLSCKCAETWPQYDNFLWFCWQYRDKNPMFCSSHFIINYEDILESKIQQMKTNFIILFPIFLGIACSERCWSVLLIKTVCQFIMVTVPV